MEIWLSNGSKDKIKIPVNPEEFGYQDDRNFEDIVLANGDEKTIKSGRNLRQYSLSSFFPKRIPFYAKDPHAKSPVEYVKKIKKWMDDGEVLQLQVTTTNINEPVTIRSFSWSEKGGTVGDYDYTLELKEYEPISYSKIKIVAGKKPKPSKRPSSKNKRPKTYTVRKHDCLWDIAKKFYHDADKWHDIYARNKKVVGRNPHLIYPGQKLVLP